MKASHPHHDPRPTRVGCAILTVSDTRGPAADRSGAVAARLLERGGHRVVTRDWVKDEVAAIRRAVRRILALQEVDVLVVSGGTGVAPRDRTPDALEPMFERSLPGFGERFRAHSEKQVGGAAWLSRAGAGILRGRLVVVLPGSTAAVTLGLKKLLIPELGHVVRLLGRRPS